MNVPEQMLAEAKESREMVGDIVNALNHATDGQFYWEETTARERNNDQLEILLPDGAVWRVTIKKIVRCERCGDELTETSRGRLEYGTGLCYGCYCATRL